MPQIIVKADRGSGRGEDAVLLRERINSSDFESATFAARLVERLGWAVDDAHAVEEAPAEEPDATTAHRTRRPPHRTRRPPHRTRRPPDRRPSPCPKPHPRSLAPPILG